jgi:pimeloyl-ACP methyl ester carboxylesterase
MGRVLGHTLLAAPAAHPRSWLFVLHGFFGAGRNWTTVARRLTGVRSDWGAVLADLRLHGASQGFLPPHTLAACAGDLLTLASAIDRPATAVLGHSFGGKVALEYLGRRPAGLRQVWIVDADPSAAVTAGDARELLRIVRAMPPEFNTRGELVAGLVRAGIGRRTAEWVAMNVDHTRTGYRWRLDFDALEDLLADVLRADLWRTVEEAPTGVELHFVIATCSTAVSGQSAARLRRIAAAGGPVAVHEVAGGHWLNADNPDALVALLTDELPVCA